MGVSRSARARFASNKMRKTSICAVGFMLWDAEDSPVIQQSVHDIVKEQNTHLEASSAETEDRAEEHEEVTDDKTQEKQPKQKNDKENAHTWQEEREAVWKTDGPMLKSTDKAMYLHLSQQLHKKNSVQWERSLRHKNMRPAKPLGHKWEAPDNAGSMHGALEELQENMRPKARLCDTTVKQHHGYFRIKGGKNKNYFYWLFEARKNPENAPVVLWLTGGPGCSSEIALFAENGPCTINKDGRTTKNNPYSWNKKATLIFVD